MRSVRVGECVKDTDGRDIEMRRNVRGYIEVYSAGSNNGHCLYPSEARRLANEMLALANEIEFTDTIKPARDGAH